MISKHDPIDLDRIVTMTWVERITFEAIQYQFGINEKDLNKLMCKSFKKSSFKMWRK